MTLFFLYYTRDTSLQERERRIPSTRSAGVIFWATARVSSGRDSPAWAATNVAPTMTPLWVSRGGEPVRLPVDHRPLDLRQLQPGTIATVHTIPCEVLRRIKSISRAARLAAPHASSLVPLGRAPPHVATPTFSSKASPAF